MSAEIYYKKAYIKVGDKFIPMVNHGSTNCWEISWKGRHVPEKNWSVLGYGANGSFLFSKTEIEDLAKEYEGYSEDNSGILKSRNRGFERGEFENWILAGMRSALTVEDYVGAGNMLMGYDCATDDTWYIKTTDQLLQTLETNKCNTRFRLTFSDNRNVKRPIKRTKQVEVANLPEHYVLKGDKGYFVRMKAGMIFTTLYRESEQVKRFPTELEAINYLEKHERILSQLSFGVECIKYGGNQYGI